MKSALPASGTRDAGRWDAFGGSAVITGRLIGVAFTMVAASVSLLLVIVGIGVWLFPPCMRALRGQACGIADAHGRWTSLALRVPVLAESDTRGFRGRARHTWVLLTDRHTWRLVRWAAIDSCTGIGVLIAIMPIGLVGWGVEGLVVLPVMWLVFHSTPTEWYAFVPIFEPAAIPFASLLGAAFMVFGFVTGHWWLRLHGRWAAALLGTGSAVLQDRVDVLTASRAEARQDAAAELRRIEREVHDGTQSQLVAIGLTLGAAEVLLTEDPERARELVAKARDDSTAALAELRDLMRGIRPPILADRGLAAALESLAIDSVVPVTARIDVPDRLDAALETAAYFAVRELLTNVIKHADASCVTIDATAAGGRLEITVSDDGHGDVVVLPGHGVDGVRRRILAFDGAVTIHSPSGGPTEVRIEVPCGS